MQSLIDNLQQKLISTNLPGIEAQYRMAHVVRQRVPPPPPDARKAGVLALLYPHNNDPHLALMVRTSKNPNDRHGGQISFPGGQWELGDADLKATALREAEEELGIQRDHVQVLGALTSLYIPVSNFLVQPYVGSLDYKPTFVPEIAEVAEVLEAPWPAFLDPVTRKKKTMEFGNRIKMNDVPYFDINGYVVWGATAMMISELLALVES